MMQHSQEAFATILQTAWEQTQLVRDETGIAVELRLTTLGLTALSGDFICSRMATVSWRELAQEADLPARLSRAIRDVADRPRPNLMSIGRDRPAPEVIGVPRDAPRAPARMRQAAGGRPGTGRAKAAKRNRKQSQM
ncbi:hypothetical protein [Methylobacterium planeticum]|uniref:Uncharacterized protein n=1 Tax=Methylobacterium planeticum TaxID=2615211 RepID=A0A6N6MSA2_9HYPH|nr:hypothetical protein [Methylobacterium planeticum]KAB1072271.1 hypothetical protein F6X51_16290 [Methylobacterium planeticum]